MKSTPSLNSPEDLFRKLFDSYLQRVADCYQLPESAKNRIKTLQKIPKGKGAGGLLVTASQTPLMDQDTKWIEQRMQLLNTHLEEHKMLAATAIEELHFLRDSHERERACLRLNEDRRPLEWSGLLVQQVEQMTDSTQQNSSKRAVAFARQQEEQVDLDNQITIEKSLHEVLNKSKQGA